MLNTFLFTSLPFCSLLVIVHPADIIIQLAQLFLSINAKHFLDTFFLFTPACFSTSLPCFSHSTVLIWLQRADGSYWPSAVKTLPCPASCLAFIPGTRRLFVGLGKGPISVRGKRTPQPLIL